MKGGTGGYFDCLSLSQCIDICTTKIDSDSISYKVVQKCSIEKVSSKYECEGG